MKQCLIIRLHLAGNIIHICLISSKVSSLVNILVKNPWVHVLNKSRVYIAVAPSHTGGTIYRLMYHNSVAI